MAGKGVLEEMHGLLLRLEALAEQQRQDFARLTAAVLQAAKARSRRIRRKIKYVNRRD